MELFDANGNPTREARAAAAAVRRHDGLVAVEANADDEWKAKALRAIERHLRDHAEFFVDDLWAAGLERPAESRALGPVILKAAREGWMRKTGGYRPSVASNGSPKPVWKSL